ncbi:MAG: beta-ketoacyl-[acyl-carrier-protein] synthase family protein [Dehalococcoidia bacterium]
MSSDAYITGLGIVSPIGVGKVAFVEGLRAGCCGLGRLRELDPADFRIGQGAEVDDAAFAGDGADLEEGRCLAFALRACREAIADAGLDGSLPEDATLALGTAAGDMRAITRSLGASEAALIMENPDPLQPPNATTSKLAVRLGLRGRQLTFVNACAAGAQAIAVGADLIRGGRAEVAVVGGAEVLTRMALAGFEALRAISPTGVHPFDAERDGVQLAELAAFVVLESAERVQSRGVRPYARVAGSGASADAFHVVRPDEQGAGAVLALRRALADAGLASDAIDYINTHGTGTPQNDPVELAALTQVFGERAASVPISSTKGMLGHALGASGAGEAVICALALRERFLPPTVGLRTPIEGYEAFDFVPKAREGVELRHVVSNAFAFGGNNVVIVLSAP